MLDKEIGDAIQQRAANVDPREVLDRVQKVYDDHDALSAAELAELVLDVAGLASTFATYNECAKAMIGQETFEKLVMQGAKVILANEQGAQHEHLKDEADGSK